MVVAHDASAKNFPRHDRKSLGILALQVKPFLEGGEREKPAPSLAVQKAGDEGQIFAGRKVNSKASDAEQAR